MKADSEVTKLNKVQREYSIQPMAHPVRDSVGRWQMMAKSSPLLAILSIPHNLNTSENLSILNLLAPLVLPIILLYSAHPPPLLLKYRSYNRTAPILRNNLPKSIRTFSNTSPNAATTSQSYSLALSLSKTQFRSHLKNTFSASRTHLNILSCSD